MSGSTSTMQRTVGISKYFHFLIFSLVVATPSRLAYDDCGNYHNYHPIVLDGKLYPLSLSLLYTV